ncbi:hypothetical protein ACYPKM_05620 [Pseudomonas aeruginosa]
MTKFHGDIAKAAVRVGNEVYAFPPPATHSNILAFLVNGYGFRPPIKGDLGYVTFGGEFLSKEMGEALMQQSLPRHVVKMGNERFYLPG